MLIVGISVVAVVDLVDPGDVGQRGRQLSVGDDVWHVDGITDRLNIGAEKSNGGVKFFYRAQAYNFFVSKRIATAAPVRIAMQPLSTHTAS